MKKLLYSLILLLCFGAASASAEAAIEARVDFENSKIVVSGTTEPLAEIPVMLFKDFGSTTLTTDNISTYAEHITSATADSDGVLPETELDMVPSGCWFTLFAESGSLKSAGIKLYYPTQAEFDAAKAAVNGATAATMSSVLAQHGKALGVPMDSPAYTMHTAEFCTALAAKKPVGGWDYISDPAQPVTFQKDFAAVKTVYDRYVEALTAINASTRETLTGTLGTYNDILGLTLTGKYAKYSGEINRTLASVQYDSLDIFKNAFVKAVDEYTPPKNNVSGPSSGNGTGGGIGGGLGVEVSDIPALIQPEAEVFTDLGTVNWAEESILRLAEKGIVAGMGDKLFNPNGNVTREQFVKMLVLSLGLPADQTGVSFTDVSANDWYAPYVMSAYSLGIVTGKDNGSFGTGENITREDMAVMVYRAVKEASSQLTLTAEVTYADEGDFSAYAAENIKALGSAGIITGMPDGTFMPKSFSTRAQAAVILDRLINSIKG